MIGGIDLATAINLLGSCSHGDLPSQRTLFSNKRSSAASRWWRGESDFLSEE
jgi:hypothetical protein